MNCVRKRRVAVRLDLDRKRACLGVESHIAQDHTGGGIKVPSPHGTDERVCVERLSTDHDPAPPRRDDPAVVIVRIIGRQTKQRPGAEFSDADRVGDVPDTFVAGPVLVALVLDARVAVVHLDVVLFEHMGDIFRGDGPLVVGVVQVCQYRPAGRRFLGKRRKQIVADRLADRITVLRRDQLFDVEAVEVDRLFLKSVGYFLRLDQKETGPPARTGDGTPPAS